MAYSVEWVSNGGGVVVVRSTGFIDDGDVPRIANDVLALMREHGPCSLLSDHSRAEFDVGVASVFGAARKKITTGMSFGRMALVLPAGYEDVARLWETASIEQGLDARAFADPDDAMAWLTA